MSSKISNGLVQVYTGTGKGKTTAALGLALRAVGKGLKVYMIQFMKGDIEYGEITTAKKMENFEIIQIGRPEFVDKSNPAEIDIELANKALEHAKEIITGGDYDIVILDEINVALDWKLIELEKVIDLIKSKPEHIELVLTGRYAPQEIIEVADLVTEMQEIKHPYNDGVEARDGIEH
ncbi:MAG: cob(I)yrinic acid a,c-diamide adenosyltransferase [Thermoplasmata archaeon]|nr:cob(I)yrinic acid a,c-diamide adenosyltransferase [Thermoplasmata archaeon]